MSQNQPVSPSETDNALEFNAETLQDLDVRSADSANVKGGAGVFAVTSPTRQEPSGGRMTAPTTNNTVNTHITSI